MKPSSSCRPHLFRQLSSIFTPIPKSKNKGWKISHVEGSATVTDHNGVQHSGSILNVSIDFLVLSSKFGQLVYGLLNHVWDQWAFFEGSSEKESSGVWIAIVTNFNNIPHVGVIYENRPLIIGNFFAIPHGFVDPGESGRQAAIREMLEETGIKAATITSLGFFGFNTAFFGGSTTGPHSDEGFLVEIKEKLEHLKFGPKESDIIWIPVDDFITYGYCSPSVTVVAKAITTIQNEKK